MNSDSVSRRNPYKSPADTDIDIRNPGIGRRFMFLFLPPLIPLSVHSIVRVFIPESETVSHALFTLGAIPPAWVWIHMMVDRLRLSFWKTYLVNCLAWSAVVASALLSPVIVNIFAP